MPVTNIDDIDMIVTDNNVTTINITSPSESLLQSEGETSANHQNPDTSTPELNLSGDTHPTDTTTTGSGDKAAISSIVNGLPNNKDQAKRVSDTVNIYSDDNSVEMTKTASSETNGDSTRSETPSHYGTQNSKPVAQISPQPLVPPNEMNSNITVSDHSSGRESVDPPLKRYSAVNQPAIGGDEEKRKGCCVIS